MQSCAAAADTQVLDRTHPSMVEHKRVSYGVALTLVATMVGQVTWVLLAYRARLETFVIQPGRFERAQALLGSDVFVFLVPLVIAIVALAALLSRQIQSRRSTIYATAVAAAIAAELVAVFVAFNGWGT